MKEILIISIPLISALIGWITNLIAIKSLFKPYKKINILGFSFQGLIPKRQKIISKKLAQIVDEHLFSKSDLINQINTPENLDKIKLKLIPVLSSSILEKVPVMFKSMAEPIIKSAIENEADSLILKLGEEISNSIDETIDIKYLIEKKLEKADITNLEVILTKLAKKELKHIELLGAVIGFIVGIFQVFLFLILN